MPTVFISNRSYVLFLILFTYLSIGVSSHENVSSNAVRGEKDRGSGEHRKYSPWTRWSHCSRTCGQKRFRSCLLTDEDLCPHGPLHVQNRPCSKSKCTNTNLGTRHIEDILETNGILGEFFYSSWSRWSPCYVSDCKHYRTKRCTLYPVCGDRILVQQKHCHVGICDSGEIDTANSASTPTRSQPEDNQEVDLDNERNDNRTCGIPAPAIHGSVNLKIFGGKASTAGSWPWQVSLLNTHLENYCAGTLISNWIVTAAHCIRRRMYIRLGEHNVYKEEETEQLYRPVRIVPHPHFNVRTIENDIALIKISTNIRWDAHVHPACLPDTTDEDSQLLANSTKCMILGWGKRKPQAKYGADVLHEAEVDVISHTRCQDAYFGEHVITTRMMCAGSGRNGRSDTCEGDSGGPLLCQVGSDTELSPRPWKLFGVTSFGDSCGKKDKYGVYTRVSMYLNWINTVILRDN